MKLSLLIPVLNWEETLPETITRIRSLPGGAAHEVVIIFDVTAPERQPEVERLRSELVDTYGVRSVVRTSERGFGSALRAGAVAATGDLVIPVMADLSDDLAVIPAMVAKIEQGADIVVGARYIKGGAIVGDTPKQRLSRLYTRLIGALTDIGCGDISNSFKMYRREVWQAVAPRSNSFDLSAELVVKGAALGYRVDQVPATWVNRRVGRSNFRLYRELVSYGRWFALSVLTMPARWVMVVGLGLPYLARQFARRRLLRGARQNNRALNIERREQTR
jgi:glycosyltransferase involved in cell wall biosynthesis